MPVVPSSTASESSERCGTRSSAETMNAVAKNNLVGVTNARTPDVERSAMGFGLIEITTPIRPVSTAADVPRDIAVGERGDDVARAQPIQAGDRIGPRHQAVPGAVQMIDLRLAESLDTELLEQAVQDRAVQQVDVLPAARAFRHAVHRGTVSGAPGIGEGGPVDLQAFGRSEQLAFADDR